MKTITLYTHEEGAALSKPEAAEYLDNLLKATEALAACSLDAGERGNAAMLFFCLGQALGKAVDDEVVLAAAEALAKQGLDGVQKLRAVN